MKLEDHFKETMRKAVANEPPVLDAWDRFERRLGRARRLRLFASLAGAAAVIAAAVIVVPQLGTGSTRVVPPDDPGPSVTSPPTVDPYAGWETFEHPDGEYRLRYPSDWRVSSFEGNWEFNPPGLPGTTQGAEGTFGVEIVVLDPDIGGELADATRGIRPDGRDFLRAEVVSDGVHHVLYQIDWSASACGIDPGECPEGEALVLHASLIGEESPEFFAKFVESGELIVASIEHPRAAGP